jgi:hypothetical protein
MLHITILSGNNNCVLVFFAVLFTNCSLLETQILGKRDLSGNSTIKQINQPNFLLKKPTTAVAAGFLIAHQ